MSLTKHATYFLSIHSKSLSRNIINMSSSNMNTLDSTPQAQAQTGQCNESVSNRPNDDVDVRNHTDSITNDSHNTSKDKILIVGLGNHDMPKSRHSIGMRFLDRLAQNIDAGWTKSKILKGFYTQISLETETKDDPSCKKELEVILLKPRVAMNINGRSVVASVLHFGVSPDCVYLIHDELDKPWGKFSMKEGGSAGGHNGVRSVVSSLQTEDIPRLRIGIDRPVQKTEVVKYVLKNMKKDEVQSFRDTYLDMLKLLSSHIEKKCVLQSKSIEKAVRKIKMDAAKTES